jgi:hypothetical protein
VVRVHQGPPGEVFAGVEPARFRRHVSILSLVETSTTGAATSSERLIGRKVVEADLGRAFAFECSAGDIHYATWGYRIQLTHGGCRVTEWTENLRPESVLKYGVKISGVEDRPGKIQEMMGTTLARLAAQLGGLPLGRVGGSRRGLGHRVGHSVRHAWGSNAVVSPRLTRSDSAAGHLSVTPGSLKFRFTWCEGGNIGNGGPPLR